MTDKDKIRAEVERLKDCSSPIVVCDTLLAFIDSLQEEKDLNVNSLTWKDIRLIAEIGMEYMNSEESDNLSDEDYYQNILNRVKEQKEKSL